MGLLDDISGFFERDVDVKTASTLTKEQQNLLNQMAGLGQQYSPEVYSTLAQFMRGQTGLTPEAVEQFYTEGVLNPALYEYETRTRPAIEEQFGSMYHSSARTKALSRSFSDLMTNMAKTRADLQYQSLLRNLQARMQAAGMMQGGLSQALNVRAFENIAMQQPSMFDIVSQIGGTAGSLMAGYGIMKGGG